MQDGVCCSFLHQIHITIFIQQEFDRQKTTFRFSLMKFGFFQRFEYDFKLNLNIDAKCIYYKNCSERFALTMDSCSCRNDVYVEFARISLGELAHYPTAPSVTVIEYSSVCITSPGGFPLSLRSCHCCSSC